MLLHNALFTSTVLSVRWNGWTEGCPRPVLYCVLGVSSPSKWHFTPWRFSFRLSETVADENDIFTDSYRCQSPWVACFIWWRVRSHCCRCSSFSPHDVLHASAVYAVAILSVRLVHLCTVSKWLNISPNFLHQLLFCSRPKHRGTIPGALNTHGVWFQPIFGCISETVQPIDR